MRFNVTLCSYRIHFSCGIFSIISSLHRILQWLPTGIRKLSVTSARAVRPSVTWSPFAVAVSSPSLPHPLGSSPHWLFLSPSKQRCRYHLRALASDVPSGHLPPSHHLCMGSNAISSESPSLTTWAKSTSASCQVTNLPPSVCFVARTSIWNTLFIHLFICLLWF